MLKELLEILSQNQVSINGGIEENEGELINTIIFGKKFRGDVITFKKRYFQKLRKKERNILLLQERAYKENLNQHDRTIILQEINHSLIKIQFLREKYDIEAQKINPMLIAHKGNNIDFYNREFFGVTKKDIGEIININNCLYFENKYTRKDLEALIKYSNSIFPELHFEFGNFSNLLHRGGSIKIPKQKKYSIKTIITIFFHETTHYFRSYNGEKNLGFRYRFSDYYTLEEGIAIYNEYYYGNKIINFGKFIPYYNPCFQILVSNITEDEKIEKIYEILKCKGFGREQSLKYYYRFHRYNSFGSSEFYLKDLVYNKGYKNVTKLIKKNKKNYQQIMSGDIGLREIELGLISSENNYNVTLYFKAMLKKIKTIV